MDITLKERKISNQLLILLILSLGFGLFKNAYLDVNSDSFTRNLLLLQGHFSMEMLLFWLLPIVTVSFLVSKSAHTRIYHFNVRYHNRKRYLTHCLFMLILETVLYTTLCVFLQLLVIILLRQRFLSLDIIIISQFLLDIIIINSLILLFDLIGKEFIYIFVTVHSVLIIQVLTLLNPIFPLVRLLAQGSDILMLIELFFIMLLVYIIYLKKDIYLEE